MFCPRAARDINEPSVDPTMAYSENFDHYRTLYNGCRKFNVISPDEYMRGTGN